MLVLVLALFGGLLAATPGAGADVTMSATVDGCLVTATISGLSGSEIYLLTNSTDFLSVDHAALASVGDGGSLSSPMTVQLAVWPGSGTLYLLDPFGALLGDPNPVASVDYVAECAPIPFELIQTEDVDVIGASPSSASTTLNVVFESATSSFVVCELPVDGLVDGKAVIPGGSTLAGTCNADLATLDDVTFVGAFSGSAFGWPYSDLNATLECADICRLTAALASLPFDDGDYGEGIEAELVLDGLLATFPEPIFVDELEFTVKGFEGAVECGFSWYAGDELPDIFDARWSGTSSQEIDGESYDFATGLSATGSLSGWCEAEDPDFDWSTLATASLVPVGFGQSSDYVEGVVNTPGALSVDCSNETSTCRFTFTLANILEPPVVTLPAPPPLRPAIPAPGAPHYTG
jgi:hypothetical protein